MKTKLVFTRGFVLEKDCGGVDTVVLCAEFPADFSYDGSDHTDMEFQYRVPMGEGEKFIRAVFGGPIKVIARQHLGK